MTQQADATNVCRSIERRTVS